MTHIFLSYSRQDIDKAKQLAEALEKSGLSVWWDRAISPGKTFDQVIETALEESSWAIVLWSARSIESNWVKAEAEEALRRNNLVPVLIEDVRPPLAFRRLEAAELQKWDGNVSDHEFRQLVEVLGGTAPPPDPSPEPDEPSQPIGTAMSTGKKAAIGFGLVLLVAGLIAVNSSDPIEPQPLPNPQPHPDPKRTTGTITLQYLGDNFDCELEVTIDVGGQTITPESSVVALNDVPLGNVPYAVSGQIGCPNAGVCTASGNGMLNARDGGTYNLVWQNTSFAQCGVTFVPAS
ncbi:MAG: toll/interleukin-1 receptor domain-containing protein [Pseudomonadales bacterium]